MRSRSAAMAATSIAIWPPPSDPEEPAQEPVRELQVAAHCPGVRTPEGSEDEAGRVEFDDGGHTLHGFRGGGQATRTDGNPGVAGVFAGDDPDAELHRLGV